MDKIQYDQTDIEHIEILKGQMTAVPGILQGGFKVVGIRKELRK